MTEHPITEHEKTEHPLFALATESYVLLSTFRTTGVAVGTPVWVARDGDRLLVTTGATSGKVKRLAHTARVELTACSMRGIVSADAPVVTGYATVTTDPVTLARLDAVLLQKYGLQYRALRAARKRAAASVALVITPNGPLPA